MKIIDKDWLFAQVNHKETQQNSPWAIELSKLKSSQGFTIDGRDKTELV